MSLQGIRDETNVAQARAANPLASAWVSANAGTGKTHVLVQRVLRLLLAGTAPERILCLTFTKAAASEMANRLFRDLSRWTVLDDEALNGVISGFLNRPSTAEEVIRARQLFALALETPGGLKVQTIHAFCERLLQRFPLEAGIAPHFSVLDEEQARTLKRQAIDGVLTSAAKDEGTPLGAALRTVIAYAWDSYFDDVLAEALTIAAARNDDKRFARDGDGFGDAALELQIRRGLGLSDDVREAETLDAMASVLTDADIAAVLPVLDAGRKTDLQRADDLRRVCGVTSSPERARLLARVFLTEAGAVRSDRLYFTKTVRDLRPDVADKLLRARDDFALKRDALAACRAARASAALSLLADAVLQAYEAVKASRAVLDFDDLIKITARLLGKSRASLWVLYKLDGGIDHILVDEAQDTSPKAWDVIEMLADEFFAGVGAREQTRTVFAVGDEKQSIYGFQGAVPEKFAAMGASFGEKAKSADVTWHRVPLTLSFRSTNPVLHAVDRVFGGTRKLSGISARDDEIRHFANRVGQSGLVEIWETEQPDGTAPSDPWDPLSEITKDAPKNRLAYRIADQIKDWLDNGELLSSHGRPIRPGDILILVRKRAPFAPAVIAALKERNIPVAGADRIVLTEQLAVMDLMALGDFLLMPEDDLALASLLKSPLFDLDDDDLFAIGWERPHSLWEALQKKAAVTERYAQVYETLRFFLARSDLKPPYEFFESLLDGEGRREQFIARLGPEAGDAIDEFLNLALNYDDMAPPSLQGFISWMRSSRAEVKRDMEQGRDEVRVMTVHGAKGLEANIVFVPDSCSNKSAPLSQSVLPVSCIDGGDGGGGEMAPLVWAIPPAKNLPAIVQAREEKKEDSVEEYHRLLYVAMTRARDRLYICGFENKTGRDRGCWYDLIRENLEGVMVAARDGAGRPIWRLTSAQEKAPDKPDDAARPGLGKADLPDWATQKAPREPMRTIPVAPSRFVPLEEDDEGASVEDEGGSSAPRILQEQPIMPPRQMAEDVRFLRGRLTHTLLEHLPGMDQALWAGAAARLVSVRGGVLSQHVRQSIVEETLNILRSDKFSVLFGKDSMAEVPISARLDPLVEGAPHVHISGQIDRLAVTKDEVFIVDYKTNRPPPDDAADVAGAYVAQLAAYRLVIGKLYPARRIKCAILWTDGPRMMDIPPALLDIHEKELFAHGQGRS